MNSAQRIASIYKDLSNADPNHPMMKIWAEIFGAVYPHPDAEDTVASCLVVLRQEINSLRKRLNEMGVPNELLDPGFESLHNVCSSTYLNQGFIGLRNTVLAPECKYPFLFASWVFRAEEDKDIDPQQIEKIRTLLSELKNETLNANVPSELRTFLMSQIMVLEKSVNEYRIIGSKAFDLAYKTVLFEVNIADGETKQAAVKADKSAPGLVTKFVEAFKSVGDVSEASKRIHDAMPILGEWVQFLLPQS